jgi:hypothetical protein
VRFGSGRFRKEVFFFKVFGVSNGHHFTFKSFYIVLKIFTVKWEIGGGGGGIEIYTIRQRTLSQPI